MTVKNKTEKILNIKLLEKIKTLNLSKILLVIKKKCNTITIASSNRSHDIVKRKIERDTGEAKSENHQRFNNRQTL